MPSIALAAAGAIVTLTVGGFASQVVLEETYAAEKCEATEAKSQGNYVMLNSCREFGTITGAMHYGSYSCSGATATLNVYTDKDCKTAADPRHASYDVEYKDDKVCQKDATKEQWFKRTCVSSFGLGTMKTYSKESCPTDSLTQEDVFAVTLCRNAAVLGTGWSEASQKVALTQDRRNVTITNYKSRGCSVPTGTVASEQGNYRCDECSEKRGSSDSWVIVTNPDCGNSRSVSGAAASIPGLMFKALALMLARIART